METLRSIALPRTGALAAAIARFAQLDGDHKTAIAKLSLHRRKGPTEPLHCISSLGHGIAAQGDKQVLLSGDVIRYGPGQSMLTTIDLPVISHVTRAGTAKPLLGLMLMLDPRAVVQSAGEMGFPSPVRQVVYRPISTETLGALRDRRTSIQFAAEDYGRMRLVNAFDLTQSIQQCVELLMGFAAQEHQIIATAADCRHFFDFRHAFQCSDYYSGTLSIHAQSAVRPYRRLLEPAPQPNAVASHYTDALQS
jgi:hypothetical protein